MSVQLTVIPDLIRDPCRFRLGGRNDKRSGFTLVELLVVISIISILSVIGITVFSIAQKNAKIAATKSELERLQSAMIQYKINNDELPPLGDDCPACYPDNAIRANDLRTNVLAVLALQSNGGPYISEIEPFVFDPWGVAYWYDDNDANIPGAGEICQCYTPGPWCYASNSSLYSSGPDKVSGTGDDIHFDIICP